MGDSSAAKTAGPAINEGVFLLDRLAPERLQELRQAFPNLSEKLKLGIEAGPVEEVDVQQRTAMIRDKAQIMITTLVEAGKRAQSSLTLVARKIKSARQQRLFAQLLVLLGSSSSLATLAFGKN